MHTPEPILDGVLRPSPIDHSLFEDVELVDFAMAGDKQAFEELVRRYHTQFQRVAYGLVKSETEAKDVVQTAFLNMYRKLHTFRRGSNFRSWSYRVVVNTGLMRLRKKKHLSEVALERVVPRTLQDQVYFLPGTHEQLRADEELERQELRVQITRAVSELPDKYRVVFELREVDGLSLQEIGDELDLSVPAVKSRLHRSRLFLRASLQPYLSDGRAA